MIEPLYTFVKGQGWIPSVSHGIECRTHSRCRVIAVRRMPVMGERYFIADTHDEEYIKRYVRARALYDFAIYRKYMNNWYSHVEEGSFYTLVRYVDAL